MVLETERLLLEPVALKHASFIIKLVNTPEWLENIGDRKIYNLEDAKKYIKKSLDAVKLNSGICHYILVHKSTQLPIGSTGIYKREGLDYPDVGFSMLTEHVRQGYAYEATKAVMDQYVKTIKPEKIEAITTLANIASQKLLIKLGLSHVGMVKLPNDPISLMKFAIDYT